MANRAFATVASNPIAAQPSTSTKLYVRSTSSSDTMNLDIRGLISATPDVSTVALTGSVEAETADVFDSVYQGLLASAPVGTVSIYEPGTASSGDISGLTNPSDGTTVTIGLVGHTQAYRFKNTLAAAYDVKIGATLGDTMTNLKKAINADGVAGTNYYTGTLANPYLSAAVSTTVVTVTDRIACNRSLGWSFAQSASDFALRVPEGGVDGTLLFSFSPGVTESINKLTFSTEDHADTTLPALVIGTTAYITTNGSAPTIRLWSDQAISYKFQSSTDLLNWHDTTEGTDTLSASTLTYVNLAERADYIRMVITTNSNTTDSIFDARAIF